MAFAFLVNMFTTKSTWFFIIIYTLLYNIGMAGVGANSFNIVYSYVDEKYITQAMSVKNCISGFVGFLGSVLAGEILNLVQKNNNTVLGIDIYGQQILCGISFIITLIAIVFIKTVIEKQKVILQ
jgi:hypothetical protein